MHMVDGIVEAVGWWVEGRVRIHASANGKAEWKGRSTKLKSGRRGKYSFLAKISNPGVRWSSGYRFQAALREVLLAMLSNVQVPGSTPGGRHSSIKTVRCFIACRTEWTGEFVCFIHNTSFFPLRNWEPIGTFVVGPYTCKVLRVRGLRLYTFRSGLRCSEQRRICQCQRSVILQSKEKWT